MYKIRLFLKRQFVGGVERSNEKIRHEIFIWKKYFRKMLFLENKFFHFQRIFDQK